MPMPRAVPLKEARKRKGGKTDPAIALARDTLAKLRKSLGLPDGVEAFLEDRTGRLFAYTGARWEEISDETAHAILYENASDKDRQKAGERVEALKAIRVRCHRRAHQWGRVADYEVPVANGVVDLRTMALRAHRATDYLEAVIPHAFSPGASSPALAEYLASCFGDSDEQRSAAAQEFAGYIVLPHARYKKALVLHGPSDTGKSELVQAFKGLVGADACAQLSVTEMDDPGARAQLVGCLLNVMSELPSDALIADGGFKALVSTEDPVAINPKYGKRFMYAPIAKHVIATNTLPRITDRTEATFNRLYVLPFDRVFDELEQDKGLRARIASEMQGVLAWALAGAKRLVERNGRFPRIDMAASRLEQMREEANPVAAFVRQMMIAEADARAPINEITRAFNEWHGGRRLDIRQVSRMLRGAFGEDCLRKAWISSMQGSAQSLVGWRLRTGSEAALAEGRQDWDDVPPDLRP